MRGATCRSCGSDSVLMRFIGPEDAEATEAAYQVKCLNCGAEINGSFSESSVHEEVLAKIDTKFKAP
jgi:uncharacterized Zn finger protein